MALSPRASSGLLAERSERSERPPERPLPLRSAVERHMRAAGASAGDDPVGVVDRVDAADVGEDVVQLAHVAAIVPLVRLKAVWPEPTV